MPGRLALIALLLTAAFAPAQSPAEPESPKLSVKWRDGLWFESPDKSFVAHVGGMLQYDAAFYDQSESLFAAPGGLERFPDGVHPRRVRLRLEGNLAKQVEFLADLEFSNGFNPVGGAPGVRNTFLAPGPRDLWVGLLDVPILGNVRAGILREPFGLERLAGARFLEFLERSYLFDAMPMAGNTGNRSPGVMAQRTWGPDDRGYMAGGFFKADDDPFGYGVEDGGYAATGRLGYLPVWRPKEQLFWHVGGSMSLRDPGGDNISIRARPPARNGVGPLTSLVAATGNIPATAQRVFDLETAGVYGRWTGQAEYFANVIDRRAGGALLFHGAYAQLLCFLTGESRVWRTNSATFDRVVPLEPFSPGGGRGAWELAARVTWLDVSDRDVFGGRLRGATLGVNWYWTANAKLQVNYDATYRDESANPRVKGAIQTLGARVSYDF